MSLIIKIFFIFLPFPFILINYLPLEKYFNLFYFLKHGYIIIFSIVFILYIRKINKFYKSTLILLMVFIFYLFINYLMLSNWSFVSISYFTSLMLLILLSISLSLIDSRLNNFKYFYYSLLTLVIITVIFSIVSGMSLKLYYGDLSGGVKERWTFGYVHPGYFGTYLLLIGMFSFLLAKYNLISKYHYIITMISCFGIIFSYTRNSLVALLIFILISYSKFTYKIFKVSSFLILPFVLYLSITNFQLINTLTSGRLTVWMYNFIYNYNNFNYFVGTGIGHAKKIELSKPTEEKGNIIFHIDNFYFEIFLQFGIFGIIFLSLFIINLQKKIFKAKFTNQNFRDVQAVFLTLLFYAFFDSSFISTGNLLSIVFWILFFNRFQDGYKYKKSYNYKSGVYKC